MGGIALLAGAIAYFLSRKAGRTRRVAQRKAEVERPSEVV